MTVCVRCGNKTSVVEFLCKTCRGKKVDNFIPLSEKEFNKVTKQVTDLVAKHGGITGEGEVEAMLNKLLISAKENNLDVTSIKLNPRLYLVLEKEMKKYIYGEPRIKPAPPFKRTYHGIPIEPDFDYFIELKVR